MTVLSLLRAAGPCLAPRGKAVCLKDKTAIQLILRNFKTSSKSAGGGHGETMKVIPSRFQWNVYKDQFHFYFFLGLIPCLGLTFYFNVFVGPSTLAEIPEGYEPEQYEYFRHPITRFFQKHFRGSWQQRYERNLHYIAEVEEVRRMRLLSWKVEKLMKERGDYPNYYTEKTMLSKYVRGAQTGRDELVEFSGEDDYGTMK